MRSARKLPIQNPVLRGFTFATAAYCVYLILLGPYLSLLESGRLDTLPRAIRDAPFYPAAPIYHIPIVRSLYDDYLQLWFSDPNEADPPTGWI